MTNSFGLSNASGYRVAQPPQYVMVPSTGMMPVLPCAYDSFVSSKKKSHFFRNMGVLSVLGAAALALSRGKLNAIKSIDTKIPLKEFATFTEKTKALIAKSGDWILNKLDFNLKDVITKEVAKK